MGGVVCLFVLAWVGLHWLGKRQSTDVDGWVRTPCEIVSASVSRHGVGARQYRSSVVHVRYRYSYDGNFHEGSGFGTPAAATGLGDDVGAFLQQGKADGTDDHCFVDPDDPTRSAFRYIPSEEIDPFSPIAWIGLAVGVGIMAIGVVLGMRRGF